MYCVVMVTIVVHNCDHQGCRIAWRVLALACVVAAWDDVAITGIIHGDVVANIDKVGVTLDGNCQLQCHCLGILNSMSPKQAQYSDSRPTRTLL